MSFEKWVSKRVLGKNGIGLKQTQKKGVGQITEMYPGASAFADKLLDASDCAPQPSTCRSKKMKRHKYDQGENQCYDG